MRLVRLARRWKLLVAVGAAASVAVLVTGALASPSQPVAGVTFELVAAPTCGSGTNRLGHACVNRSEIPTWTTIADGSAKNDVPGQWLTTYSWKPPPTVDEEGDYLRLKAKAEERTGQANARICPAISARSGFTFKGGTQPAGVGFCAEAVTQPKPPAKTKTIILLPPKVASGSTVRLTIYVQYALEYTYTYRAVKEKGAVKRLTVDLTPDEGFVPYKATLRNGGTVRFCNRLGRAEYLFSRSEHKAILFHSPMYDIRLAPGCVSHILRNPTKRPILLRIHANASRGWLHEGLDLTVLP
jgi:hypothetical protein